MSSRPVVSSTSSTPIRVTVGGTGLGSRHTSRPKPPNYAKPPKGKPDPKPKPPGPKPPGPKPPKPDEPSPCPTPACCIPLTLAASSGIVRSFPLSRGDYDALGGTLTVVPAIPPPVGPPPPPPGPSVHVLFGANPDYDPSVPIPPPPGTNPIVTIENFGIEYVAQEVSGQPVYDHDESVYIVRKEGTYKVEVDLNLFLLVVGWSQAAVPEGGGQPIVLNTALRYSLYVYKRTPGLVEPVLLASRNGAFFRGTSLPGESQGTGAAKIFAINESQQSGLQFLVSTNPPSDDVPSIAVGDELFVAVSTNTPPTGNFQYFTLSVTASSVAVSTTTGGSFFNVHRISAQ